MRHTTHFAAGATTRAAALAGAVAVLFFAAGCAPQDQLDVGEPKAVSESVPATHTAEPDPEVVPVILPPEEERVPLPRKVSEAMDWINDYFGEIGQEDDLFSINVHAGSIRVVTVVELSEPVAAHIEGLAEEAGIGVDWASSEGLTRKGFDAILEEFASGSGPGGKPLDLMSVGLTAEGLTVGVTVYDIDSDPVFYEGMRQQLENLMSPYPVTVGLVRYVPYDSEKTLPVPLGEYSVEGSWVSIEYGNKFAFSFGERGVGGGREDCNSKELRWGVGATDHQFDVVGGSTTLVLCNDTGVPRFPSHGYVVVDGDDLRLFTEDGDLVDTLERVKEGVSLSLQK